MSWKAMFRQAAATVLASFLFGHLGAMAAGVNLRASLTKDRVFPLVGLDRFVTQYVVFDVELTQEEQAKMSGFLKRELDKLFETDGFEIAAEVTPESARAIGIVTGSVACMPEERGRVVEVSLTVSTMMTNPRTAETRFMNVWETCKAIAVPQRGGIPVSEVHEQGRALVADLLRARIYLGEGQPSPFSGSQKPGQSVGEPKGDALQSTPGSRGP